MVRVYVKQIKAGKLTLEDVPERWYAKVKAALEAE